MTGKKSLFASLRGETTVLRHKFARSRVPGRPDIVRHDHDLENCLLCALIQVADTATSQVNIFHADTNMALIGALTELERIARAE